MPVHPRRQVCFLTTFCYETEVYRLWCRCRLDLGFCCSCVMVFDISNMGETSWFMTETLTGGLLQFLFTTIDKEGIHNVYCCFKPLMTMIMTVCRPQVLATFGNIMLHSSVSFFSHPQLQNQGWWGFIVTADTQKKFFCRSASALPVLNACASRYVEFLKHLLIQQFFFSRPMSPKRPMELLQHNLFAKPEPVPEDVDWMQHMQGTFAQTCTRTVGSLLSIRVPICISPHIHTHTYIYIYASD